MAVAVDAAVVHVADAEAEIAVDVVDAAAEVDLAVEIVAEIADSRLPKPIDNLKKAADISAAFFVCQSVLRHSEAGCW